MTITHAKVSTKPDSVDTTLVLPSDWNADHTGNVNGMSGLLADDQHVLDAEVTAVAVAHALATAANDFLVASGSGAYIKKTLAETLTILGKAVASGLASLDASSKVVQDPASATATPTAGKIPIADGSGLLDGWVTPSSSGGLYGINVETLSGNKTLTSGTDEIYQYLDEGGANRTITLDTASATAGDRWVIRHNGVYNDTHYLFVYQGATFLESIYAGNIKEFIFDGTNWISRGIGTGTGDSDDKKANVGIGSKSNVHTQGTAVGYQAIGYSYGAAVGHSADGNTQGQAFGASAKGNNHGVGIGNSADGANYGVAIGYATNTNDKEHSFALGYRSECERTGETSVNINGDDSDQENNVVQGRFERTTTDATPVELWCAGQANARFTIRASSVLAFTMLIVARDNVADEVARYSVADGLIKRDAANNTTMVACTVVADYEDDAGWAVAVTADDTNEALIITVTGDATNPTQWAAVMDGVETHF